MNIDNDLFDKIFFVGFIFATIGALCLWFFKMAWHMHKFYFLIPGVLFTFIGLAIIFNKVIEYSLRAI